jgi:hypothetical protein
MNRRAFALLLVLLLVLVSGVMIAVMVQRHAAQVRSTRRELDAYAFAHATRGMGDALDAWIKYQGRGSIAEALDSDGNAFAFTTEDGQRLTIALVDGQGLALSNLAGLSPDNMRLGREILRRLWEIMGEQAPLFARNDGPLAISVNSAPPEVLTAVLRAITGNDSAEGLVADLLSRRQAEGLIDQSMLVSMIDGSELAPDHKNRAKALLTASPALWRVEASLSRGGLEIGRYRAWAIISRGSTVSQGDRATAVQRSLSIFGWERVQPADYPDRRNLSRESP